MKWLLYSRIPVAVMALFLVCVSSPQNIGLFFLSILGLVFGVLLFDHYHSQLMNLVMSNKQADWFSLAQKQLYVGLILGYALQGLGLISLMTELKTQYHGFYVGLFGLTIWMGIGASNKLFKHEFVKFCRKIESFFSLDENA